MKVLFVVCFDCIYHHTIVEAWRGLQMETLAGALGHSLRYADTVWTSHCPALLTPAEANDIAGT